jgi:hypothetical protein
MLEDGVATKLIQYKSLVGEVRSSFRETGIVMSKI